MKLTLSCDDRYKLMHDLMDSDVDAGWNETSVVAFIEQGSFQIVLSVEALQVKDLGLAVDEATYQHFSILVKGTGCHCRYLGLVLFSVSSATGCILNLVKLLKHKRLLFWLFFTLFLFGGCHCFMDPLLLIVERLGVMLVQFLSNVDSLSGVLQFHL